MGNVKISGEGSVKKLNLRLNKQVLIVGALILAVAIAAVFMVKYNNLKKQANVKGTQAQDPAELIKQENEKTINEVSQLIELPSNEVPVIYNVTNTAALKDQAFFANAQNGDKLLVFKQAKKAILYRPSTKKLIKVEPINIDENQNQQGITGQDAQTNQ